MTDAYVLTRFLEEQLPTGFVGAVRAIRPGDEALLTPTEAHGLERAVPAVRRASGAGRDLARMLCRRMGVHVTDIPRSSRRYPVWPPDIVGSIAHDADFVASAVGAAGRVAGLGIDIEPAEHLPAGVGELVASTDELGAFADLAFREKALFSIKEAVFKAVYPRDGIMLDFHDIVVARESYVARTAYGRAVRWRVLPLPRVLAIAWW